MPALPRLNSHINMQIYPKYFCYKQFRLLISYVELLNLNIGIADYRCQEKKKNLHCHLFGVVITWFGRILSYTV